MSAKIYVNLAVSDLQKSIDFFGKVGFSFNEKFTDENSTCMVIADTIYVMLLTTAFFKTFTQKTICDSKLNTETILAIEVESKSAVDDLWQKAMNAGAEKARDAEDHGWMYARSFEDPDGHIWEVFWMDESKAPKPKK